MLSEGDKKAERGSEEKNHNNALVHSCWFVIFSQNMRRRSSPSLCTHQSLHFSSPSWNSHWKDNDLSLPRRLKKIDWKSYAKFQNRHSRNASKTGRNPGSDV
jgi:hypothetical protein